jgi:hypothetical protein
MQGVHVEGGRHQKVIEAALALLLMSMLIVASFWVLLVFVGVPMR